MITNESLKKAEVCIKLAKLRQIKIATAESCTGGMLSTCLTAIPGSSSVFECGFVTYSNDAKIAHLQVPQQYIEKHGAVSAEVAQAMAHGALNNSLANLSISITGIAGPTGGDAIKPIGLVYISCILKDVIMVEKYNFDGDRNMIRSKTVNTALDMIQDIVT